jgi:hypothetical protein
VTASETLLVNFFYCAPVGHAVEALRYCLGYHRADPSRRISVVLNADTATELAGLCPFVSTAYPVGHPLFDAGADPQIALAGLPRDWDWVVRDGRGRQPGQRAAFPGLARYHDACDEHFRSPHPTQSAGGAPPAYVANERLSLNLPADARARAGDITGGAPLMIAVMPAGSSPRWYYPSVTSWRRILQALTGQHPEAVICLVGKQRTDNRTRTSFGHGELHALLESTPGAVNCFDLPLIDQLAIVERCRFFLSPHTGFGMAALAVGTPWLTISGNRWFEFFFNQVPFYSVIPDPDRFPAFTGMSGDPPAVEQDTDGEGRRSLSMSADRIAADLSEIVDAAGLLIDGRLGFERAMADHFERMRRVRDLREIWSMDGAHLPYV